MMNLFQVICCSVMLAALQGCDTAETLATITTTTTASPPNTPIKCSDGCDCIADKTVNPDITDDQCWKCSSPFIVNIDKWFWPCNIEGACRCRDTTTTAAPASTTAVVAEPEEQILHF